MRKHCPQPVIPPRGDWKARLAARRRVADWVIRSAHGDELSKLHTRARHAAAERLSTPKPQT